MIHQVELFKFTKEHAEWLLENVKGDWRIFGDEDTEWDMDTSDKASPWYVSVVFDIEEDAVAFKMRWVD